MTISRVTCALLAVVSLHVAVASHATQARPFESKVHRATVLAPVWTGGVIAADFDSDGIDEVITVTSSSTPAIIVYSNSQRTMEQRQIIELPGPLNSETWLHVWHSPQGPRLVSVSQRVEVYGGWPLRLLSSHNHLGGSGGLVADVDADGEVELLTRQFSEITATRLDGTVLWRIPVSGTSVAAENLDADPVLEIIVTGISGLGGRVYDGATRLPEWTHAAGFGWSVAAGKVGRSASGGFVGAGASSGFAVFGASPWGAIWEEPRYRNDALGVFNLDGSGADEIVTGDSTLNVLRIFDSQTGAIRRQIQTQGAGRGGLAAPRIRRGDQRHLVQATNALYQDSDALVLVDPASGAMTKSLMTDSEGIRTALIHDVDGDGRIELVMNAKVGGRNRVRIADIHTGDDVWLSTYPANANEPFAIEPRVLLSAQLDDDPSPELVIAGNRDQFSGMVLVMDGSSKQVQLQIGGEANAQVLAGRLISGAVLTDFDGDGYEDIVVSSFASATGQAGVLLHVFSLITGDLILDPIALSSDLTPSRGLFLSSHGDQTYVVAALGTGLRALGVKSRKIEWTHVANVHKALLLADGLDVPEIVIEDDAGGVTHLDALTRDVLRNYSLAQRSNALAAVPNAPYLVAAFESSLALLRADGSRVGSMDGLWIGDRASPLALNELEGRVRVLVGTERGFRLFELDPERFFKDGFESF